MLKRDLLLTKENTCADCDATDPKWVSINLGVVLCIQCAGVHRSLGTHVSQMRSIVMDDFSQEELKFLDSAGNAQANIKYEQYLHAGQKIDSSSSAEERKNYIVAKYVEQIFTSENSAKMWERAAQSAPRPSAAASVAMMEYSGILLIHLIEAKDLIVADIVSSDPYVIFQVGPQKVKSKVIDNTLNPKWDEHLQLCISGLGETLNCTLYDKDLKKDDFMGECSVDLSILKSEGEAQFVEIALPLKKVKRGSIHFKIAYTSISH